MHNAKPIPNVAEETPYHRRNQTPETERSVFFEFEFRTPSTSVAETERYVKWKFYYMEIGISNFALLNF